MNGSIAVCRTRNFPHAISSAGGNRPPDAQTRRREPRAGAAPGTRIVAHALQRGGRLSRIVRPTYFLRMPSTTLDGSALSRYTRSVAFLKSDAFAFGMSTKVCGFRSVSGNHELCTCTMMR